MTNNIKYYDQKLINGKSHEFDFTHSHLLFTTIY
jgi:hypothetical protein